MRTSTSGIRRPGWYDWLAREPEILRRRFVFDDARDAIEALNVVGTVLVQAADHDGDTDAMLAEARTNPLVLGVVGYLPLEQPARAAAAAGRARGRRRARRGAEPDP